MEEIKTLEELNEEYNNIRENIPKLRERLEQLKKSKEEVQIVVDELIAKLGELNENYEFLKETRSNAPENIDSSFITSLEEKMTEVNNERKIISERLKAEQTKLTTKQTDIATVGQTAYENDNRMNLILVSFASNPIINSALKNEINIDYDKEVDKREEDIESVQKIMEKMQNDEGIKARSAHLSKLLEEFAKAKESLRPEEGVKKLDELNSEIAKDRRYIRGRMTALGLKGVKVSRDDIFKMADQITKGEGIEIEPIQELVETKKSAISTIEEERANALSRIDKAYEISTHGEVSDQEYEKAKAEIENLDKEISELRTKKSLSETRLSEISDKRSKLQAEFSEVGKNLSAEDEARLASLRVDLENIDKEDITIDNPEIAKLKAEIAELRTKGGASEAYKGTPEYKDAESKLNDAQKAYDEETKFEYDPDTYIGDKSDIVETDEYKAKADEISQAKKQKDEFIDANGVKDLYEGLAEKQELLEIEKENVLKLKADKQVVEEAKAHSLISDEDLDKLDDEDSDLAKAYALFEQGDLAVRKAMLDIQKNPSDENLEVLKDALNNFDKIREDFKSNFTGEVPSNEAIYKYLMDDLAQRDTVAPEYNLASFDNQLAIAKKFSENNLDVEDLAQSSYDLTELMTKYLKGEINEIDQDEFIHELSDKLDAHRTNFEMLADDDKDLISGKKNLPEKTSQPKGLFRRMFNKVFNRMPKAKVDYAFDGVEFNGYNVKLSELDEQIEDKESTIEDLEKEVEDLEKDKTEVPKAVQDKIEEFDRRIKGLEAEKAGIRQYANPTKQEKLRIALGEAEKAIEEIRKKFPATDFSKEISEKEEQIKHLSAKVEDPDKKAQRDEKKKAKQQEIDKIYGKDIARDIASQMEALDKEAQQERDNISKSSAAITTKSTKLKELRKNFKIMDVVKRIGKMIQIRTKDARKMHDSRGKGTVARDLADEAKKKNFEDLGDDER